MKNYSSAMTTITRHDPLRYLGDELDALKTQGLYRHLRIVEDEQRAHTTVDGRSVVNLSSNNYLGLTTHPRLRERALEAVQQFGVGSGSVRTIAGTMAIHMELERRLAEFKHTEAVVVFQSGFTANAGTVSSILTREDVVISDALNHASIIDGCRLSRAAIKVFPHKDVDAARTVLQELPAGQRKLLITDGVFSMDGDLGPLPALCDLAEEFGCIMMVDDAHASGVFGQNGRGTVDHFGMHGRVDVQVGTLSKAMGGARRLRGRQPRPDRLPLPPRTAVPVLDLAPAGRGGGVHRRDRCAAGGAAADRPALGEHAFLQSRPRRRTASTPGISESPITPVIVGDGTLAMQLSDRLFQEGVFAQGIAFPTVAPRQGARAHHRDRDAHERRSAVRARRLQARGWRARDYLMARVGEKPRASPLRTGMRDAPRAGWEFFETYTRDLSRRDFKRLFTLETPEAYRFFARGIDETELKGQPWHIRAWRRCRAFFMAFTARLSPARRALYGIGLVMALFGILQQFHGFTVVRVPVIPFVLGLPLPGLAWSDGTLWLVGGFLAMNLLVMLEVADRLTLKRDLEIARDIQRAMLPQEMVTGGGLEAYGFTRPANTVGGDFYDVLQMPDGRLVIALGDVSGKGSPAALLMALTLAILRTLVDEGLDPAALARRLNVQVARHAPGSRFVTMFLAVFDPVTGALHYVNAGQNPPILRRVNGALERLTSGGVALGMFELSTYTAGDTWLAAGDVLVLYSDGITEAENKQGVFFDESGLEDVINRHWWEDAATLGKAIVTSVEGHATDTQAGGRPDGARHPQADADPDRVRELRCGGVRGC